MGATAKSTAAKAKSKGAAAHVKAGKLAKDTGDVATAAASFVGKSVKASVAVMQDKNILKEDSLLAASLKAREAKLQAKVKKDAAKVKKEEKKVGKALQKQAKAKEKAAN